VGPERCVRRDHPRRYDLLKAGATVLLELNAPVQAIELPACHSRAIADNRRGRREGRNCLDLLLVA